MPVDARPEVPAGVVPEMFTPTQVLRRVILALTITVGLVAGTITSAGAADAVPHDLASATTSEVVAVESSPSGAWIVDTEGRIAVRGDAIHHGDLRDVELAGPIVDLVISSGGSGYLMVGADGGVFAFGDAVFRGSAAELELAAPIVSLGLADGGYWLAASDGGVFAYGAAPFVGSAGALDLADDIVAIDPTDAGYRLVGADGGVFAFGDAEFHGSLGEAVTSAPVVAVASTDDGYWLASAAGELIGFGVEDQSVEVPAADIGAAVLVDVTRDANGDFRALTDVVIETAQPEIAPEETLPSELVERRPEPELTEAERYVAELSEERLATWDALAWCESTGRWDINTGNGYYGGIQFHPRSWRAVGGEGYPHEATRIEQIYRGELLLDLQGWGAWPGCSRKLGLR